MNDATRRPLALEIQAFILIYRGGGTTAEEMLAQVENALDIDSDLEAIVQGIPDVWELLVKHRERCKAEGIEIKRVQAIFLTRHINNNLASLFKIDDFGKVDCTVPHNENGYDLVSGNVTLSDFGTIYQLMLSIYSHWKGTYSDPKIEGDLCQLVVGAISPYGEQAISTWTYGSHSTQPPDEILQIASECELISKKLEIRRIF